MSVLAAWWTDEQWEAVTPPRTNGSDARSPAALLEVVAQFPVETATRYAPMPGATRCNTYAWDVTRALSCEIPHWLRGRELRANDLVQWLEGSLVGHYPLQGPAHGWREVDEHAAVARAGAGFPTVCTWRNPNPKLSGHIAIVMPSDASGRTMISQAGRSVLAYAPLANGFGSVKPIRFWTHD